MSHFLAGSFLSLCRGCGGCSFPGTPALTRRQRKIGAKEDGDDHVENSLHFPHRHLDPLTAKASWSTLPVLRTTRLHSLPTAPPANAGLASPSPCGRARG